jgi:hypothetical protein
MTNDPLVSWNAQGRTLKESANAQTPISITEYPESFNMGDGSQGPFGVPIDAPLAVSMIKALREMVAKQPPESELRQMLEGSFAITLDKNVLLKTLSQPKCEGIRFYLCAKTGEKGEPLLSLVTVGIDEAGKDLLYDYREGTAVADIPTRSLVAEYGYPPGTLAQSGTSLDPFVLFKFSQ